MADTVKYIKKIKIDSTTAYTIKDGEAVHSINGYDTSSIESATVQFANDRITDAEIDALTW